MPNGVPSGSPSGSPDGVSLDARRGLVGEPRRGPVGHPHGGPLVGPKVLYMQYIQCCSCINDHYWDLRGLVTVIN